MLEVFGCPEEFTPKQQILQSCARQPSLKSSTLSRIPRPFSERRVVSTQITMLCFV